MTASTVALRLLGHGSHRRSPGPCLAHSNRRLVTAHLHHARMVEPKRLRKERDLSPRRDGRSSSRQARAASEKAAICGYFREDQATFNVWTRDALGTQSCSSSLNRPFCDARFSAQTTTLPDRDAPATERRPELLGGVAAALSPRSEFQRERPRHRAGRHFSAWNEPDLDRHRIGLADSTRNLSGHRHDPDFQRDPGGERVRCSRERSRSGRPRPSGEQSALERRRARYGRTAGKLDREQSALEHRRARHRRTDGKLDREQSTRQGNGCARADGGQTDGWWEGRIDCDRGFDARRWRHPHGHDDARSSELGGPCDEHRREARNERCRSHRRRDRPDFRTGKVGRRRPGRAARQRCPPGKRHGRAGRPTSSAGSAANLLLVETLAGHSPRAAHGVSDERARRAAHPRVGRPIAHGVVPLQKKPGLARRPCR